MSEAVEAEGRGLLVWVTMTVERLAFPGGGVMIGVMAELDEVEVVEEEGGEEGEEEMVLLAVELPLLLLLLLPPAVVVKVTVTAVEDAVDEGLG